MRRVRGVLEGLALAACVITIVVLNFRTSRSPLMLAYLFSLALFAQSSISFRLASAWNHRWWLAHGIFAALALDLDHFKDINDRHGHQVGDEVLKALVAAIREDLRTSDLVAHTGGDEFKILLPDTALAEAVAVAERIRARVAALAAATDQAAVNVIVSIGCAALEGDLESTERVADERLYRAKALGRNRVVSAAAAEASDEPDATD